MNKSEIVFELTSNDNAEDGTSDVVFSNTRRIAPMPFTFRVEGRGHEAQMMLTSTPNKGFVVNDYQVEELLDVVYTSDSDELSSYSYNVLVDKMKRAYMQEYKSKLGTNKCKDILKDAIDNNLINQITARGSYYRTDSL